MNIKKIVEKCLDGYIIPNSRSVRDYIDLRCGRLGRYNLVRGMHNSVIYEVFGEYHFYDIRQTDTVLDIGAFSMFISQSVKQVYAVEPLFTDILETNIDNNSISNIDIIDVGLGNKEINCAFMDRRKIIKCKPLSEIIKRCGGQIDVLKCDCEGGEWSITKEDLEGIRRIEMEVHTFNGEAINDFLPRLDEFNYILERRTNTTYLIHATHKTAQGDTN